MCITERHFTRLCVVEMWSVTSCELLKYTVLHGDMHNTRISSNHRHQDWVEAAKWYSRSLEASPTGDGDSSLGVDPPYTLLSRLAEMHRTGGHGLGQDCQRSGKLYTQAAEAAMAAMKGKMANRFFMLAEEVWSEIQEEEGQ